jgi:hypothetical protein
MHSIGGFILFLYVTYPEDPLTDDCSHVVIVTGVYM